MKRMIVVSISSRDIKAMRFDRINSGIQAVKVLYENHLDHIIGTLDFLMAPPKMNLDIYESPSFRTFCQKMFSSYPLALLITLNNDFFAYFTLACLPEVVAVRYSLDFMPAFARCKRSHLESFFADQRLIAESAAPEFGISRQAVEQRLDSMRDYLGLSEKSGGILGTSHPTPFYVTD